MRRNPRLERLLDESEHERRCAVGLTDADRKALARRVVAGELLSPYRNIYVRRVYWSAMTVTQRTVHVARALAILHPEWIFAGLTAATIHGYDHSFSLHDGTVTIASSRTSQSHDSQKLHRIRLTDPQVLIVNGLRVTDPVRTLLDCGSAFPFEEALSIYDAAVRRGVGVEAVAAACNGGACGVDGPRIAKLCEYADGRSENGGESKIRALMIGNGFLKPQLQRRFENPDNPLGPYRSDFSWDLSAGIVVAEYDGMAKYTMPQSGTGERSGERRLVQSAVHAERRREDHLRAQGVVAIARLEFEDTLYPGRLIHKLLDAGVPRVV